MLVGESVTVGVDVSGMAAVYIGRDVLVRIEAGCGEEVADGMRVSEDVTVGEDVSGMVAVYVGRGVLVKGEAFVMVGDNDVKTD